jgi:hypothetical protein
MRMPSESPPRYSPAHGDGLEESELTAGIFYPQLGSKVEKVRSYPITTTRTRDVQLEPY